MERPPTIRFLVLARSISPTVGRSGSASEHFAVFTASARSLPSLMYSIDEDRSGLGRLTKCLLADISAPRFAERDLWNIARDRLHWLDVGRHNHLAPFLGFVGDELAEISGRACKHRAAQIGKPCFEFWICNADIDFLVQSFDELYGRALRSTNAVPCTCLVVWQRVAQKRNVWQHLRPRRGGYGQGAQITGPDIANRREQRTKIYMRIASEKSGKHLCAAIRHVKEINAGQRLEHFARHVGQSSGSG